MSRVLPPGARSTARGRRAAAERGALLLIQAGEWLREAGLPRATNEADSYAHTMSAQIRAELIANGDGDDEDES